MSKSMKPRIWLQYQLDIPVCLKLKIFLSYHVLKTYFRIFGFENQCIAQVECKGLGTIWAVFGPPSNLLKLHGFCCLLLD